MQYGVYLNASGALAAEARLDVIANNLANVDTPGFRRGFAVFQARLAEAFESPREPSVRPILDRAGGGVLVHRTTFDTGPGPREQTDQALDLAIDGDGWFHVDVGGRSLYTRAGNFGRAPDGRLVTADGLGSVLDTEGAPIVLENGRVAVSNDGTVNVDDRRIARLAIRGQLDHQLFEPVGGNLFRYLGEGQPELTRATIQSHTLERSTVSPVREMVGMIRTFRAYEANQSMIRQQDETFDRAVNEVGRLG